MNIYKQKLTILQQEMFRFLSIHAGSRFTQNQIATSLSVSPAAISKSLALLISEKFIIVNKDKNTNRLSITLDRENLRVIDLKRVENLKLLVEPGFLDFLRENHPGKKIILFGTYSRGEDIETSDIDIAVICKDKEIDVTKFEKILYRKININYYDGMPTDENLKNNLQRGLVLEG